MRNTVDVTQPLELTDGTAVVYRSIDCDGDLVIDLVSGPSCLGDGKDRGRLFHPGGAHVFNTLPALRNVAPTYTVVSAGTGCEYTATLVAKADGVVLLKHIAAIIAFDVDSGKRINGSSNLRLKLPPVTTVTYRTFGYGGFGGCLCASLREAMLLKSSGDRSNRGVLKFTSVDGKLTAVELAASF